MNLITKPVEITTQQKKSKVDYVSLLGLKKEVPQSTQPTYGITISDDVDKLRTELSLLCKKEFGTANVDSPLTDCNMDELSSRGFTFFGSDETNVLIVDSTDDEAIRTLIRDELGSADDYMIGYIARYAAKYNSNLPLDVLGNRISSSSALYKELIDKLVSNPLNITNVIGHEMFIKHEKYICILRWS